MSILNVKEVEVREIKREDVPLILNYWFKAEDSFLHAMGVDVKKMPTPNQFAEMLLNQIQTPMPEKKAYCLIWLYEGKPIGHCNLNPIHFAEEASLHLHIWAVENRKKNIGTHLLKLSLPLFFEHFQLKKIISEPFCENQAPNKTLEKAGFTFEKEYLTTPGFINYEQRVKRWVMTKENFLLLKHK